MPEKEYKNFTITKNFNFPTRKEYRKALAKEFVKEEKGSWTSAGVQIVTKYRYNVETLSDGRQIYLSRPAQLHKGFDFAVIVERFKANKDRPPRHKDVQEDLENLRKTHPGTLKKLMQGVEMVWNCGDPEEVIIKLGLDKKPGMPVDLILKLLKWLFIEQDMAYWSYDGRMMLWRELQKTANSNE